jgi:hypothetical protein
MIAAIEATIAAGARGGIVPRAALAGCPVAATGICPLGPASRKPAASLGPGCLLIARARLPACAEAGHEAAAEPGPGGGGGGGRAESRRRVTAVDSRRAAHHLSPPRPPPFPTQSTDLWGIGRMRTPTPRHAIVFISEIARGVKERTDSMADTSREVVGEGRHLRRRDVRGPPPPIPPNPAAPSPPRRAGRRGAGGGRRGRRWRGRWGWGWTGGAGRGRVGLADGLPRGTALRQQSRGRATSFL